MQKDYIKKTYIISLTQVFVAPLSVLSKVETFIDRSNDSNDTFNMMLNL